MKKREFIVQDLLSKIYQEEFKEGKLPNQRKLAQIYGVSRFTIQQAVKNLEEIGIVRVVQGSGIFVHEKWVKNPLIFNSPSTLGFLSSDKSTAKSGSVLR